MIRNQVREASLRLPERQREALELRDRDGRSYEEIAAALGMNRGAVGKLIARARINLYDELRGTPLASLVPSPDCERALPLIAMREDGELEAAAEDPRWLDSHLADCERCALAVEQMGEAEAAYRGGASADPGRETDRRATVAVGPMPTRRRRAILAAALAGLLLAGGFVVVLAGAANTSDPVEPAAIGAPDQGADVGGSGAAPVPRDGKDNGAKRHRGEGDETKASDGRAGRVAGAGGGQTTAAPVAAPVQGNGRGGPSDRGSGGGRPSGKAAVQPSPQTVAAKPTGKPKRAAPPAPAPSSTASTPPPASESTAGAAEEAADGPGRSEEAPGKPANRPSH